MMILKKWQSRLDYILAKQSKVYVYNNESLAKALEISERQLFRHIKKSTGLSPQKYLRQYRLQQAMNLLQTGKYRTVNETAYAVGYSNVGYFIAQFEKNFKKKPLQVLQENGWR